MHTPFFNDFPFVSASKVVYFDNAATTQRHGAVIAETDAFSRERNASVNRSAYPLANAATHDFEKTRSGCAELINAPSSNELVFTSGATESLNIISQGLQRHQLCGRKILICASEHHANLLPWQALAKRLNLEIEVLELESFGRFTDNTLQTWLAQLSEDVALIACAHVSNVLGNVYPIEALCAKARKVKALSVIDGTQALAHMSVDVQSIDCDFYVGSAHKMYGPTGLGLLWGKYSHLESLEASKLGGEMVKDVSFDSYETQAPPLKFEAGTPNFQAIIAFSHAVTFVKAHMKMLEVHEKRLTRHLMSEITNIPNLEIYGNVDNSVGIVSFCFTHRDNHDAALQLYQDGFALRFGQHCAMPLLKSMGIDACLRVSLACYNSIEEIDHFIEALVRLAKCDDSHLAPSEAAATDLPSDTQSRAFEQSLSSSLSYEKAFLNAKSWPEKHRQLLLLSKELPLLPQPLRNDDAYVAGCEARVWLTEASTNSGEKVLGYSDSKVIRGILSVLLLKHQHLTNTRGVSELKRFDYINYLNDLGLSTYFSQGRKDGVLALVKRLNALSY